MTLTDQQLFAVDTALKLYGHGTDDRIWTSNITDKWHWQFRDSEAGWYTLYSGTLAECAAVQEFFQAPNPDADLF